MASTAFIISPEHCQAYTVTACLLLILASQAGSATIKLRWSDDFRPCKSPNTDPLCVNGGVDLRKWSFELGDGTSYGPSLIGWGNWQRQCHTNASTNVRVEKWNTSSDGYLVIQGRRSPNHNCYNANAPPAVTQYTSARLHTRNKAAFMWGGQPANSTAIRIDVRAKVPMVMGTWPAAWMLPETNRSWCMGCGPYGDGWCIGGELDIMEHTNTKNFTISNVHYGGQPDRWWESCNETVRAFQMGYTKLSNSFNNYSMVWSSSRIAFYANSKQYNSVSLGTWRSGGAPANPYAPFDVPFYMILDLAIGGLYPGFNIGDAAIDAGDAKFLVDSVKVYDILP